jgi:RecB family exonuclease
MDRETLEEGTELHRQLAELRSHPPAEWAREVPRLLETWIVAAPDELKRVERERRTRRVVEVMSQEAQAAATATAHACEDRRRVQIAVPGHQPLMLNGSIDRVDHLPGGRVRLIDYKRGAISAQMQALKDGTDGQLLGYLLAAQAAGWQPEGAYYLSLRDGARAGWGTIPTPDGRQASKAGVDLAELDRLAGELGRAIAALAGGVAAADPDGRSGRDYAPIARIDERRLDLGMGADG